MPTKSELRQAAAILGRSRTPAKAKASRANAKIARRKKALKKK